ncbi:MAG: 16S rRNA (cytosine(1402)-N(4))-methyltransferase RsmH [Bacteroidales bacterium]|nr:16S rRNA (cytosine(1402)-N(4))-methyltransferase RsmH [Bacteroidales bacterium]MDD3430963.1 16S rRNA (cytosine(1402)-N(4))-methyltransferase RsmH [Bacteroidales bacterium]MDD4362176.1 16S rRNA (cytosine(1402)-N(4))-methyltransferase RsmH [Bacteroidales bacterium]MDD4430939.1 16S rRNA (cytosine(1402)-N(4))-methyltransferase RsmH [Bacteroidales bacterium]
METQYHIPALLRESIEGLALKPGGIYVDATFGGGGHSRAILAQLQGGRLYSFDQDEEVLKNLPEDKRLQFVHGNFRFLSNFMRYYGVEKFDGLLADLGVSFHHFDQAGRGFSFRFDADLDMRMNQRATRTAADILADYSKEELCRVFRVYGEFRQAAKMADVLIKARQEQDIRTVGRLVDLLRPLLSRQTEKKDLARAFQALRIELNQEVRALEDLLTQALDLLKPGGRLVVISYHSLEDRLVKNFMKTGNLEAEVKKDFYGNNLSPFILVNNKVLVPSAEEQEKNPRSRSARLRIAEKRQ